MDSGSYTEGKRPLPNEGAGEAWEIRIWRRKNLSEICSAGNLLAVGIDRGDRYEAEEWKEKFLGRIWNGHCLGFSFLSLSNSLSLYTSLQVRPEIAINGSTPFWTNKWKVEKEEGHWITLDHSPQFKVLSATILVCGLTLSKLSFFLLI